MKRIYLLVILAGLAVATGCSREPSNNEIGDRTDHGYKHTVTTVAVREIPYARRAGNVIVINPTGRQAAYVNPTGVSTVNGGELAAIQNALGELDDRLEDTDELLEKKIQQGAR